MADPMFEDMCWLLECQMATLDYYKCLKRPPKGELRRHEEIVRKALDRISHYLGDHEVPRNCPRVYDSTRALLPRVPVITEVFLQDELPVQGVATVKGQEVFFQRALKTQDRAVYRCWNLIEEEWATLRKQPMDDFDHTNLKDMFEIIMLREPIASFSHKEADWSAVEGG
jgi:hypothetical protein